MSRVTFAFTAILLAACGAAMSFAAFRATPAPGETVYTCATEQMKAMGYDLTSHNDREWRVTAQRENPLIRRSDPTFRKALDRLVADADPAEASDGTTLRVSAHTVLEHFNRRGPTFDEIQASEHARASADTLLARCAGSEVAPATP